MMIYKSSTADVEIVWNEGHTFNVFSGGVEVDVFSSDYSRVMTVREAREFALEWVSEKINSGEL